MPETLALVRAGCPCLGESRPQQLWEKAGDTSLADQPIEWRLIGHLQRNKVKRTVETGVHCLDSVDSLRLLQAIDEAAEQTGLKQSVLLEVNNSATARGARGLRKLYTSTNRRRPDVGGSRSS